MDFWNHLYYILCVWPGGRRIVPPVGLGRGVDVKAVQEGRLIFRDVGDGVEKTLERSRPRPLQGRAITRVRLLDFVKSQQLCSERLDPFFYKRNVGWIDDRILLEILQKKRLFCLRVEQRNHVTILDVIKRLLVGKVVV